MTITLEEEKTIFGDICEVTPGFVPKHSVHSLYDRLSSLEHRMTLLSQFHNINAVKVQGIEIKLANESI